VPFPFTPVPVEPGAALNADIAFYRKLCTQVGLPPSSPMLLLTGSRCAKRLFLRRAAGSDDWLRFMEAFYQKYPKMRFRMAAARTAVTAIPSGYSGRSKPLVPEIIVGWALLRALDPRFSLARDEPLPGVSGRRCDFSVHAGERCIARIEVAGMIDGRGEPRTLDGHAYLARQPDRLRAYAAAGLPPPIIVNAGELFGAGRRRQVVARILKAAAG
jgi:hypothetical protein